MSSIETLRRIQDKATDFITIVKLIALKLPYLYDSILPFSLFLASVFCLDKLNKSYELIAIRAAGISARQFIWPILFTTFFIGIVKISLLNPVSVTLLNKYENSYNNIIKKNTNIISISNAGIWLKDLSEGNIDKIIYATSVNRKTNSLYGVNIFLWNNKDIRIQAESATIDNKELILKNVSIFSVTKNLQKHDLYVLKTSLAPNQLQQNLIDPTILSFWQLPKYIKQIELAGFSSINHKVRYYSLLFAPLSLVAITLISSSFIFALPRNTKQSLILASGVALGLIIYFFEKVIFTMGLAGNIDEILASLIPSLIAGLIGTYMLLHFEE